MLDNLKQKLPQFDFSSANTNHLEELAILMSLCFGESGSKYCFTLRDMKDDVAYTPNYHVVVGDKSIEDKAQFDIGESKSVRAGVPKSKNENSTSADTYKGVIGTFGFEEIHNGNESRTELKKLYIHPTYRKQGCAKALVQSIEEMAKEKGHSEVCLSSSEVGVPFYKKIGYGLKPDVSLKPGECPRMFKRLI